MPSHVHLKATWNKYYGVMKASTKPYLKSWTTKGEIQATLVNPDSHPFHHILDP